MVEQFVPGQIPVDVDVDVLSINPFLRILGRTLIETYSVGKSPSVLVSIWSLMS